MRLLRSVTERPLAFVLLNALETDAVSLLPCFGAFFVRSIGMIHYPGGMKFIREDRSFLFHSQDRWNFDVFHNVIRRYKLMWF